MPVARIESTELKWKCGILVRSQHCDAEQCSKDLKLKFPVLPLSESPETHNV